MSLSEIKILKVMTELVAIAAICPMVGCSRSLPPGAVGNIGRYNYSPSIIQTGNLVQVWWCSEGPNPADASQNTDAIYYQQINMLTGDSYGPKLVLAETPGAWDSVYTCNPKVIGGVFENPLGDGRTFHLAMYYVATAAIDGLNNSIGVAFSNDGIAWFKYPEPVITSTSQLLYGVGQPSLYNRDHGSGISMFYEDSNPTFHHVAATSTDGLHFTVQGTLTSKGLDPDDPDPTWGDMSYDPMASEWYAVFNRPIRPPSSTGGVLERGQPGIELYKISQDALLSGDSPWRQLVIMDTNSNGFESSFIAGIVHDSYGNIVRGTSLTIRMYVSVSYPAPRWYATPAEAGDSAAVGTWILMPMEWRPGLTDVLPLNRYFDGNIHEVTTGWIDADAGFQLQSTLGHLYASPIEAATVPFYGCKRGQKDYFISPDVNCEGERLLGKQGYAYPQAVPAQHLVALYRCFTGSDHFVSQDPKCEGKTTEAVLGYVLP